jgi:multiple sugar transport system ATP-binding protein
MARVILDHLGKVFRGATGEAIRAVSDLCLTIEDKEFFVLVGPSGCGKTTTLRLIAGLEDATHGTISIAGQIINNLPPKERDIAMVFQNYALYPHKTVYENLAFPLILRHFPREAIRDTVCEVAEILELTPCLERLPRGLSGGQRQRVALGRAMVRRPKVFLFDEPLANLDLPTRAQMRLELSRLHQRLNATMIYVTHDQAEAMTMGGRMAVMQAGQVQQVAAPLTIYRQPANLFVAAFVGFPPMNLLSGVLETAGEQVFFRPAPNPPADSLGGFRLAIPTCQIAPLASHAGKPVILGIRPEHLTLRGSLGAGPADASVEAIIDRAESPGADTFYHLRAASYSFVARLNCGLQAAPGTQVSVAFDLTQARFFDPHSGHALGGIISEQL